MVENPVFDLKIKHFSSVHGWGTSSFVVPGILYRLINNNKKNRLYEKNTIVIYSKYYSNCTI